MHPYFVINYLSAAVLLMYNLLQYRRKKLLLGGVSCAAIRHFQEGKPRGIRKMLATAGFWTVLEILIFSAAQYGFVEVFVAGLGKLLGIGATHFGMLYFEPWVVVLACILLKMDPLAQLDLIAPAYPLALIFGKIACHFGGCCRGVEWERGLFNPVTRQIEFPSPLLEAGVALIMFIFILFIKNKLRKGTVFPVYLMTYSFLRFFTEFTRSEPKVFMGLKAEQLLCIVGIIVGVLEYFVASRYQKCRAKDSKAVSSTRGEG